MVSAPLLTLLFNFLPNGFNLSFFDVLINAGCLLAVFLFACLKK